jgi:predicted alpha/beta hydrolase family esterase
MLPAFPIDCPSLLVSSRDDPWMRPDHAALWARRWGSVLVDVGPLGHINAESGLGDWQFGQDALQLLYERAHNERPAMSST